MREFRTQVNSESSIQGRRRSGRIDRSSYIEQIYDEADSRPESPRPSFQDKEVIAQIYEVSDMTSVESNWDMSSSEGGSEELHLTSQESLEREESTIFFVLQETDLGSSWKQWPNARLEKETVDSVFKAVSRYDDGRICDLLEIKLQIEEECFSFPVFSGRAGPFDRIKKFMMNKIEADFREKGPSEAETSIWITPKEIIEI